MMNETEKLAFHTAVQKINEVAASLKLKKEEIAVVTKLAALRHGKPLKSPLHSAELTLKELLSVASRGEVGPGDFDLDLTGPTEFLQSDKEKDVKIKEEIKEMLGGADA